MRSALDESVRDVVASYIGLYAEHQRLMASPPDSASYAEHILKLQEHVRRVQVALDQVLQKCKADTPALNEASRQKTQLRLLIGGRAESRVS